MVVKLPLILASASPARVELLAKIKLYPDQILPAAIDETELPKELPAQVAKRLSALKAEKVAGHVDQGYILAADTVAAIGRRTLPKALDERMVADCLKRLSGRKHRLYTGVSIIKKEAGLITARRDRLVMTSLQFKRLHPQEIAEYLTYGEGLNKAGGYSIQGFAESYITKISGSVSNVIGLPLYETRNMLQSLGALEQTNE